MSGGDSKRLGDQEVLSRLTSSVSCALDEAAAALTRMRSENSSNFHQEARYERGFLVYLPLEKGLVPAALDIVESVMRV